MPNDVDGPDVVWRGLNAVMTVAEVTATVGRPPLCTGKDCAMTTHRRGACSASTSLPDQRQLGHPNRSFVYLMAGSAMANLDFAYDLTLDEARRRSAVLEAIGDDWDPIAVLAEEQKAYDMLYSDLDEEQQRVYDELVRAGVLPERTADRVTD
jgi:hypothetical protein